MKVYTADKSAENKRENIYKDIHPPAGTMNREAKTLLLHCTTLLDTYNADFDDIEQHIADYLDQKQIADPKMISLLMKVVEGCVRYLPVINIVLNNYFATNGQHVKNPEINIYVVLTYFYLFELDQMTLAYFKKLANNLDPHDMYKFLAFAMQSNSITSWMKDGWCQVYDGEFVNHRIVEPLLRALPELHEYMNQLKEKLNNKTLPQKKEIPNTVPQPFNLTQPRPRNVPIPMMIPMKAAPIPVPETTYNVPQEMKKLESKKFENKLMAKKKLWEVDNLHIECANATISCKTYQKLKAIEKEREAQLKFNKKKAIPLPNFQELTPIKMTKAAILREGQLHLKREEAEIQKWEELESGTRDMSQFVQWQTNMKNRDWQEQQNEVESFRLKAKISHEDAILSKHKLKENNRQLVQDIKQKAEKLMQIFLQQQIEEEEKSKQIVLSIAQGHKKAKEARKNIQEYKKKIVEEMHKENQQLMADALEQAETEMRNRLEVINEIRAMAAMSTNRHQKLIDLTQTANIGLLCEMSLVELKERLILMKTEKQRKIEQKRDEIFASKQASQDLVFDTLEIILKHRNENSASRKNQVKERKPMKPEITDEKVLALKQELEEKKSKRKEHQVSNSAKISSKKLNDNYTIFTKVQKERLHYKQMEIPKEKSAQPKFGQAGHFRSMVK